MRRERWRAIRRGTLLVIVSVEAIALAGLGLSLIFVGIVAGDMVDELIGDGSHHVTATMIAVGVASWIGAGAFVAVAVAIGTNRGYVGDRHAAGWQAILAVGVIAETGWIIMVATSDVDPGAANRAGWIVVIAASLWTAACLALELRSRRERRPEARPAPPSMPAPPTVDAT